MSDPTQRFSSRVENYIKYRPHYPADVIRTLAAESGLSPRSIVADVGSGTGISTELFLRNGNEVFAVEPNREMREAAERLLGDEPRFHSVDGRAEATTLPDSSADFIVAGQAFHWFDRDRARGEFLRILKPAGWVVLIWNERATGSTPFLAAYEQLLRRFATDYEQVNHTNIDEKTLDAFFGRAAAYRTVAFPNRQEFDLAGVQGRLLSSSYAPEKGHPNHEPMLAALRRIFDSHQTSGHVAFIYRTAMYVGRLD
jgi:SAM-dependent methyltransferase